MIKPNQYDFQNCFGGLFWILFSLNKGLNMFLKKSLSIFVSFFIFTSLAAKADEVSNGITYTFSGGRFGDNVLAYIHAKYISHLYGMPLFYKPFTYSDLLAMDKLETPWYIDMRLDFNKVEVFEKNEDFKKFQERDAFYIVPYFPDFKDEYRELYHGPSFEIDWDNKEFIKELKETIKPVRELELVAPPKGSVNVAVHVRKGGGPDSEHMTKIYFLKFPPEEYYISQIKRICRLYPHKKVYAHIFTNDSDPSAIVLRFQTQLKRFPVKFGYRNNPGSQEDYVLEDFFSMMNFDCIIRPDANLSYIAAKIGKAKLEIFPISGYWQDDRKVIDKVGVRDRRKDKG